jgi:hypothetical protein
MVIRIQRYFIGASITTRDHFFPGNPHPKKSILKGYDYYNLPPV